MRTFLKFALLEKSEAVDGIARGDVIKKELRILKLSLSSEGLMF